MLNLKKTAVAVLALGSSAVFAGTMGPVCTPGNVTVPCEKTAWEIGGYALYLDPVVSAGGIAAPAIVANGAIRFGNDSNWQWGFLLEAGYHYGTGNDINVNWYYLDNNRNYYAPTLADFNRAKSSWNQVNVEMGQLVDISATNRFRFHGGIQYSQVAYKVNPMIRADRIATLGRSADYNGFGPRAGIDYHYGFGNGIGIYGKGAAALLVGPSGFTDATQLPDTGIYVSGSRTSVVPEFDAKLGANYTYSLAQGDLVLDAGYLWVDYVNVHQLSSASATITDASVGFNGPYFGLKYVGNV